MPPRKSSRTILRPKPHVQPSKSAELRSVYLNLTTKLSTEVPVPENVPYTFSSSPRAVYANRKMVQGRNIPLPYQNLMFEKRICRGTNFSPSGGGDGESAAARAAAARRRSMARKKAKMQQVRAAQLRLGSPPPVKGRKHEPVQTEDYLEEIFSHPPTATACTQTELFLERPVSPFYVPAKTGRDQETQIYAGDLFDFDMEVQPILEVLVGKTVEQALIEVLEEEELAALREQQRRFLEIRAAETAEAQRLEEREKRLAKEKERRMKEYESGVQLQKEMEERIAASILMQGYMADLLPNVLEGLENEGFLLDSVKEEVDDRFMPWLMREVTQELKAVVSTTDVLTELVREILECRAEVYKTINLTPREEICEEEGPVTQEDLVLADHLKLKEEIMEQEHVDPK